MAERDTGGAAFPTTPIYNGDDPSHEYDGMSLRDYFAAKALAGLMAFPGTLDGSLDKTPSTVARTAYNYADAMLAERAR